MGSLVECLSPAWRIKPQAGSSGGSTAAVFFIVFFVVRRLRQSLTFYLRVVVNVFFHATPPLEVRENTRRGAFSEENPPLLTLELNDPKTHRRENKETKLIAD